MPWTRKVHSCRTPGKFAARHMEYESVWKCPVCDAEWVHRYREGPAYSSGPVPRPWIRLVPISPTPVQTVASLPAEAPRRRRR